MSLGLPGGSTIGYGYDAAGFLTSTVLKNGASVLDSYGYTYDAIGWRTNVLRTDGSLSVREATVPPCRLEKEQDFRCYREL